KGRLPGDPRWEHLQDAARVHGRDYNRPRNDPAPGGPVLRIDGGRTHVWSGIRCFSVPTRDAGVVRHLLQDLRVDRQGRTSKMTPWSLKRASWLSERLTR